MDLNGDGYIDILSGSYSRPGRDMAGLFQVFYGQKDGTFRPVEVLNGSDGEPLIITPSAEGNEGTIDKICTRPFAADLNGDGKLDIVSGNFKGTFAFFAGEGDGKFSNESTLLEGEDGPIKVDGKSDPFLIDFNGDGLLDIVSGASGGGVFLFENVGTKTAPKFSRARTLVPAPKRQSDQLVLGDAHLTGPGRLTRVWVDDIDGDGKLDLLVGDSLTLNFPVEGVAEASIPALAKEWDAKIQALHASRRQAAAATPADQKKYSEELASLMKERQQFMTEQRTGFIWLLRQK